MQVSDNPKASLWKLLFPLVMTFLCSKQLNFLLGTEDVWLRTVGWRDWDQNELLFLLRKFEFMLFHLFQETVFRAT